LAGVAAPATGSASAKAAPQAAPAAPAGPAASAEPLGADTGAGAVDEAAVPEPSSTEPARPAESAPARAKVEAPGGGRVLKSGPGYTLNASAAPAPAAAGRRGHRCLRGRAGVCDVHALPGPQPPGRQRLVPRSRGQHLELTRGGREPPFSAELAAVVAGSLEALNASDVAREALGGAPLTV